MGVLSEMMDTAEVPLPKQSIPAPVVTEVATNNESPKTSNVSPAHPCPTCNSFLAWEAISGDGILRCDQCSPPPAKSFVERWWGLDGSQESGFTWVVIEKGGRGSEQKQNNDRSKTGTSKAASPPPPPADIDLSTLPPLTWSTPDLGGWCYGVDVEGRLQIRQHRLVVNGGLAIGEKWLTETEEEWQRRAKAVDEFWRANN